MVHIKKALTKIAITLEQKQITKKVTYIRGHFAVRVIACGCFFIQKCFLGINVLVYQFWCYYHKMHTRLDCG